MATALCEISAAIGREPQPQLDAVPLMDDVEACDLVLRRDDAFGKAEANGEILQVAG